MPYGGNFSAVGGFSIFGSNDVGGGGKTKKWRSIFGGNTIRRLFSAVSDCSFFGGNMNGDSKLGGNCGP